MEHSPLGTDSRASALNRRVRGWGILFSLFSGCGGGVLVGLIAQIIGLGGHTTGTVGWGGSYVPLSRQSISPSPEGGGD